MLFNKDKTVLIKCPQKKSGTYIIPDSVTELRFDAFFHCNQLTRIVLPEGLTEIGSNAFYDCEQLECIKLPESQLVKIEEGAFDGTLIKNSSFENTSFEKFPSREIVYEYARKKYSIHCIKKQNRRNNKSTREFYRPPEPHEMIFIDDKLVGFRLSYSASHGTQYGELMIDKNLSIKFPYIIPHDVIGFDGADLSDFEGPCCIYDLEIKEKPSPVRYIEIETTYDGIVTSEDLPDYIVRSQLNTYNFRGTRYSRFELTDWGIEHWKEAKQILLNSKNIRSLIFLNRI